jgi:hypothetical protein
MVTLIYCGTHIRILTSLFKDGNLNVAFRTTPTISKLLKPYNPQEDKECDKSSISKLFCATCNLSYVGQTGRRFKQLYSEHVGYIQQNNSQSAYVQNILQLLHEFGPISGTLSLIQQVDTGKYVNTIEQYYIQEHKHNKILISEQNPGDQNPLFCFLYDLQLRHSITWLHTTALSRTQFSTGRKPNNNTQVCY